MNRKVHGGGGREGSRGGRIAGALVLVAGLFALLGVSPLSAQGCDGGCVGDIGTAGVCGNSSDIHARQGCVFPNCQTPCDGHLDQWENCEPEPYTVTVIGVTPPSGDQPPQYRVSLAQNLTVPWNRWAGDPEQGDNQNGTLDITWYENAPEAPEPWGGVPGPISVCEVLHSDWLTTDIQKTMTCEQMRTYSMYYSLRASVCAGPCPPPYWPNCGAFCGRWLDLDGLLFAVPEEELNALCPREDKCECTEGGGTSCPKGSGPAGEGPSQSIPGSAPPGEAMANTAGGAGAPGAPAGPGIRSAQQGPGSDSAQAPSGKAFSAEPWSLRLGRYWSHRYAMRLVDGRLPGQVWLITGEGLYREFWDADANGTYEWASPRDHRFELEPVLGGYDLTEKDGTVHHFGSDGFWLSSTDRQGNATVGSYEGGALTAVSLPDGRRIDLTYSGDGKLATMTEVGIDDATSRTWSYTWSGDDLTRLDRPDGTAWRFVSGDPRFPGYLTRQYLVATDASERLIAAWAYDAFGNVIETWGGAEDPGSAGATERYRFAFDEPKSPRETTITDPLGNDSTATYDRDPASHWPLLRQVTGDCPSCGLGPNSQLSYEDSANPLRPTRITDGRGTVTVLEYDALGNLLSRTEALGTEVERARSFEYTDARFPELPTASEVPSSSGSGERRSETVYDGEGNPGERTLRGIEAGSAFAYTTLTTFNFAGQPETIDPPGMGTADVTRFSYDPARGNLLPLTRTDPLIGDTQFGYDPWNRRTSVTDPNGVSTETAYDALDRVREMRQRGATPAEDLVTTYEYTPFGDLWRTILPAGNVIEYGYDAAGRLISIERKPDRTTPGERVFFTLDAYGHRTKEEQQRWTGSGWETLSWTGYAYATRCQLDRVLHADGSVTEYAFDCAGNLERVWDANHPSSGQTAPPTQSYGYDARNRLTSLTQPWSSGSALTGYGYDMQDHLTRVTDAEGNLTRYTYSDRDLLTEQVSTVSGTTSYRYTEHGELFRETDARGVTVERTLDALDRVSFVDFPENALDTTYVWDDAGVAFSKGRLTAIVRNGGSVDYRYDRWGRRTQDGSLSVAYDGNGNRRELTYPGGVKATWGHDYADREVSLTLQDGGNPPQTLASAATYSPGGPLTGLTLGNGRIETHTFDARLFPATIQVPGLLNWRYTTDDVGNPTEIADELTPGNTRTYGYQDVAYFLTSGRGPWGNLSWTYDKIGNRLTETRAGTTSGYAYLGNDAGGHNPKLLTVTPPAGDPTRFYYDAIGDQTFEATDETKTRLDYNAERRLSQIFHDSQQAPNTRTDLVYDGRSFLATSKRYQPPTQINPVDEVTATYGSEGVLYHRKSVGRPGATKPRNASTVATDAYLLYFAGRPLAQYEKTTTTPTGGGSASNSTRLVYLTTDHLGTPVLATDAAAATIWAGGLEPFGLDYAGAEAAGVFIRFAGQWSDPSWQEASAYYNLYRWYETQTARYSRPDPLDAVRLVPASRPADYLYAYVSQRPLVEVDPMGLSGYTPGGPYHPPGGVNTRCYSTDNCPVIRGKMWVLMRMIDSHTGWDQTMPPPRGGGRHAEEIANLWFAYARCQRLWFEKECDRKPECEPCKKIVTGAVAVGAAYFFYRCIRMIPSLFPPLWPTIPVNAAVP